MYVYHGTSRYKEKAIPSRHTRTRKNDNGSISTIFDDTSFHASSHYWIALAYTYSVETFRHDGKSIYYNMSIDLYSEKKEIVIHGHRSLDHSLKKLYGNGGYVLAFDNASFFHKKGLGTMECITQIIRYPVSIIKVNDPVANMKSLGVSFKFLDLSNLQNTHRRNIVS